MQSFSLKRKNNIPSNKHSVFDADEDEEELDPDVDWLTAAKRPKLLLLEDKISKAKRLHDKGIILAEEERWWEALNSWGEVVSLTPDDHTVYDMIAQAHMKVGEIFPAVRSATLATELAPLWWPGHQTLGRAQLGVGEVSLAVKSFSKAIRLSPNQMELWKDDLEWTVNLRTKRRELEKEEEARKIQHQKENSLILEEIKEETEETITNTSASTAEAPVPETAMTKGNSSKESTIDNFKTLKDVMTTPYVLFKS